MKTIIIPESDIENYRSFVLANNPTLEECKIRAALIGYGAEVDVEEAKKKANIGDCMLFKYNNMLIPMQVIDKKTKSDGTLDVVLQSYYLLEQRAFDQNTNVYKDSEIRRYLNGDFLKKFDSEFVKLLKTTDVHTDNYVTHDKMWLLSHEEIGYVDDSNMFKPNKGSSTYEYYKTAAVEEEKLVAE